jgi:hypothetical protein
LALITLTIQWAAPFSQTDVCYIYRDDGGRQEWSEADQFDLATLYPYADRRVILERYPARSWLCIMSYASDRGLVRSTKLNTSGITDRVLSLRDHELLQANGWSLDQLSGVKSLRDGTEVKDRVYWLYDVPTENDTSVTASDQAAIRSR